MFSRENAQDTICIRIYFILNATNNDIETNPTNKGNENADRRAHTTSTSWLNIVILTRERWTWRVSQAIRFLWLIECERWNAGPKNYANYHAKLASRGANHSEHRVNIIYNLMAEMISNNAVTLECALETN